MKNNIKKERQGENFTQVRLAEIVGVSRQTIISIEINKYIPSVLLAVKLANALGKSVEELFFLEESDEVV